MKNHPNDKNMFNQVSLVSLKVFGQPLGNYESSVLGGNQVDHSANEDYMRD
jgi:hypothetical protein